MRPSPEMIPVLVDTAKALKGSQRRLFMAKTVAAMGRGGQLWAEAHLPHLLADLEAIVSGQSQADPSFRTTRLYTRLTAAEVRRQLIAQKGYTDERLPTQQTINKKLNLLGYRLTKVAKCRPQKGSSRPTLSSSS